MLTGWSISRCSRQRAGQAAGSSIRRTAILVPASIGRADISRKPIHRKGNRWRLRASDDCRGPALSTERFGRIDIDGLEVLVDGQDYGEADYRLGSRQHDHENREDLPVVLAAAVESERQVIDIGRVENQLDAHEDADGVAARQHAQHPERKNDEAQDQKMVEPDSPSHVDSPASVYSRASCREMTIAPINAASSTSEATSNGNT